MSPEEEGEEEEQPQGCEKMELLPLLESDPGVRKCGSSAGVL